ncbi:MAG: hypothetical protein IJS07_08945 [Bacteroidales bacterium]|nr:hypothetical protein [Bacteroidales bacterium]
MKLTYTPPLMELEEAFYESVICASGGTTGDIGDFTYEDFGPSIDWGA